jgi:hypothetical protein
VEQQRSRTITLSLGRAGVDLHDAADDGIILVEHNEIIAAAPPLEVVAGAFEAELHRKSTGAATDEESATVRAHDPAINLDRLVDAPPALCIRHADRLGHSVGILAAVLKRFEGQSVAILLLVLWAHCLG